jgi:membrane-associated phospholipid phosphatase
VQAARWISIVGHPFVMVAVLIGVAGPRVSPGATVGRSALLVVVVALAPVAVLMWRQVRAGRWSNADASNVEERPMLFGVALAALGVLIVWLLAREPESFLVRGTLGVALLLVAAAVLTRWMKVSLHMAFASMAGVALFLMSSVVGTVVLAGLPVLAWSRLKLARHRPSEVVAGLILGVVAGAGLVNL